MNVEQVRAEFPLLERCAYLNAGTFGPLRRRTVDAVEDALRRELEQGRSGKPWVEWVGPQRERVRALYAEELGVDPPRMALTTSTTQGCNIVLLGLGLGPEDEIVTTDVEHFGLIGPVASCGARVRVARIRELPAAEALDAILAEVTPRTRLIALSHVAWSTGHVLPVRELKEATGVPLLVDGAQSVGAIPVDARPFDFYTVSGQKWLCGPDATGALYVADPDRLRVAAPSYLSQTAWEATGAYTPREGAARFETAFGPVATLAGVKAALTGVPEWRFERAAQTAERARQLIGEHFEVVTEPGQSTLVSFVPAGDAPGAVARANERGVVVRDLPGLGWIRASIGYWTTEEDVERLVEALR